MASMVFSCTCGESVPQFVLFWSDIKDQIKAVLNVDILLSPVSLPAPFSKRPIPFSKRPIPIY